MLKVKPYPFQSEAIEFAIKKRYSINAFSMGLGKTLVALATADREGLKPLVVCPAYLKHNWLAEANKFLGSSKAVTVMSYNKFTTDMDELPAFDMVIADEAHYLKNPKAARTKAMHAYIADVRPKMLMLLTGTPVKNGVPEIWSLLKLCSYGPTSNIFFEPFKSSHWQFCSKFCNRQYTYGQHYKFTGIKNADLLKQVMKPWYLRKRASQVLDLPEQVRKRINIGVKKHDADLEKAWDAYSGGKVSEHFSTVKAVNALAKVEASVEAAQAILDEGQKVVIFTDHVKAAESITRGLGAFASCIVGSTSNHRRADTIDKFTSSKTARAIVATIGAMSVGVNLQAASYMIINDVPWVPADLAQAEKRIHRIGQKATCFYYYIFASEVDEAIYDKILSKLEITNEVANGNSNSTSN